MTDATRITGFERGALSFTVRDTGPADGTPVVLLHGFPQNSSSWAAVAERLNHAGYRTLAPDQRGYSPQATPRGRRHYRLGELVDDVVALVERAGAGPVHLVGHDWGAAVAWGVAALHPRRLRSLTAVSVPHPSAFASSMLRSNQLAMSWYMAMFQLPWLPEWLMRTKDGFVQTMLTRTGQTPAAARRDIRMLQQGHTATGALNYYRALPWSLPSMPALRRPITVPTLQVWSDRDTAVGVKGHELSERFVAAPWRLVTLPGVSHWVPEEAPAELAGLIDEHAASTAAG
ncbi:alpha/beta fold hydrolase [Mycolicibacillus parakoreensis]|uniref:Alpha/beta fold hydrolase n=1 Tax=Mycolicibacillus parakoreensis TaxID=1069221 RepID=A0ABY3U8V4_9MYCO|nr:alpha/beta fold hydrolase [Mycolicibacillus parakoreensis]MCV7317442.1 alpha/beta fold hydrolase [Mycolicibacillus parakoreensis]ULN53938.1 alpha/beta fold hydrolase [Mycolicibacillus parakoreensis]